MARSMRRAAGEACCGDGDVKGEGKPTINYLLSDEVWDVCGLHFEGAVVGPQVDRIGDAGAPSLVDL